MSKGQETRRMIIEKAAQLFNIQGMAATSMNDIRIAAKVSKSALYVHFSDKEELLGESVDHNIELFSKKLLSDISRQKSAKDKLFAYIDVLSKPNTPPVVGGCPMLNFGMEADDTNGPIKEKIHRTVEISQKIIRDIIEEGIKAKEFKQSWNYEEFATAMFAMIEGGQLICRVSGSDAKMQLISKVLYSLIEEQTL